MHIRGLFITTALLLAPAFGGTVVLPNAETSIVGNDSSGSLAFSSASSEVQDIWAANQFPTGGSLLITQLAFRLKPGTGSITATDTSASIFMSTTPVAPGSISPTFAANRGADYTQVLPLGLGTLWASLGCAGPGPCPFDIVYNLTTPFPYNPTQGFLLIDFFINGYNGVGTGKFDVQSFAGPAGSPVGEVFQFGGGPTGSVDFSDNITQLTFTLVPEPGSFLLGFCGIGVLAGLRGKRKIPGTKLFEL